MTDDARTVERLRVYWTLAEINEMLADLGEPLTTLEELERAGVDFCSDAGTSVGADPVTPRPPTATTVNAPT